MHNAPSFPLRSVCLWVHHVGMELRFAFDVVPLPADLQSVVQPSNWAVVGVVLRVGPPAHVPYTPAIHVRGFPKLHVADKVAAPQGWVSISCVQFFMTLTSSFWAFPSLCAPHPAGERLWNQKSMHLTLGLSLPLDSKLGVGCAAQGPWEWDVQPGGLGEEGSCPWCLLRCFPWSCYQVVCLFERIHT